MASDELGRLRVMLSAQTAEYIADVKKAKAETTSASKDIKGEGGVGGINTVFRNLIAAGVVAKAGQMLVDFAVDSVNVASDVEESMSKARVVFGETFESVASDLEAIGEPIGRSKYELIEYAATLQDTFVPLGFAREEAAAFSVEITELAVDLASFNNLNTADVVRDIQSALVGNTETLRKYGVVASQAAIEQEALNSGLWDGSGALDAQTKAQAIYQLILRGTTDAQGDALRTADSLANKQRELESAMLDLKVAIGNELEPATGLLVQGLINAANAVELLVTWGDRLAEAAAEQRGEVRKTAESYEDYVDGTLASAVASGRLDQAWVNLHRDAVSLGNASRSVTDDLELMTQAEWDGYQAGLALEETDRKLAIAHAWVSEEAVAAADATQDLAAQQDILNQKMADLQLFISGPVGKELDSYQQKMEDLQVEQGELNQKIAELESKQYLTQAQKQELEALRTALGQNQEEMGATADAHEDATRRIIFDLIAQRAALDGLSEAEFAFLNEVALRWGLVDQATYDATQSIDQALTDLAEGESFVEVLGQIEGIDSALRRVPTDIDVGINIRTNGQIPSGIGGGYNGGGNGDPIPAAHGLDMKVPEGYPNDSYRLSLALTSGERLMVLTEEQQRRMQFPVTQKTVQLLGDIHLHGVQDAPSLLAQLEAYRVNG